MNSSAEPSPLLRVLDRGRWAPSGDNMQVWRFEVMGPHALRVHGFDTRSHCVYDLDGHPSQISLGALLETLALAASEMGWSLEEARRLPESPEEKPVFELRFDPDAACPPDPLARAIETRCVQRRPFRTRPLNDGEKRAMEAAVGAGYSLLWLEGAAMRWRTAKLLFHSAKLRLTLPEAYEVHRDVIEWGTRFSKDRIPDAALGANPATVALMRQVMKSWGRVQLMNRFFAGTWAPRIELDLLPGLGCAAHFVLLADRPAADIDDYVAAGRAMQRLWLSATTLGLQFQPEVTPLVFARYAREKRVFSSVTSCLPRAQRVKERLEDLIGQDALARAVFMGRVGEGDAPTARSLRKDLAELMHKP